MTRRPIPTVAGDLETVRTFLKDRGILTTTSQGNVDLVTRRIHAATYSLILWRFRLKRLPEEGRVFIEEIASDSLQILPQTLMGFGKTVNLLTRGIIENTLRHIYFSHHPVEFAQMNRKGKWFMTMDALFGYAKDLPVFEYSEPRFDALARLSTLYSELSGGVHGRAVRDLEMRTALKKITYDDVAGDRHAEAIQRCAASTNFLLAMFHREQVQAFQTEDRRIVLRTMPAAAREIWKDYDP
jgi:hypothetical protein